MAVYTNNTKMEFLDKKETTKGSVLQQIEEADSYLKLNNKIAAKIIGLDRIENPEYSSEVLIECLLNSVGHRDYEIPGSTLVHIFKDNIEFLSLGGLVKGLTVEDIKIGSSASRNPKLVSIFHRLGLVETYGSGIPRILDNYRNYRLKPEIVVAPHSFLFKIPKFQYDTEYSAIIDYLRSNKSINREKVEELLNVKKVKAVSVINEMLENDILIKEGSAKYTSYKLNK